jgi:hypothetical protein
LAWRFFLIWKNALEGGRGLGTNGALRASFVEEIFVNRSAEKNRLDRWPPSPPTPTTKKTYRPPTALSMK